MIALFLLFFPAHSVYGKGGTVALSFHFFSRFQKCKFCLSNHLKCNNMTNRNHYKCSANYPVFPNRRPAKLHALQIPRPTQLANPMWTILVQYTNPGLTTVPS